MDSFLKVIKFKDGRQMSEALIGVQTMPSTLVFLFHKNARPLRKKQHLLNGEPSQSRWHLLELPR